MSHRTARARFLSSLGFAVLAASAPSAAAQTAHSAGKVPISTASAEAKADYLKGRTLAENLRAHESREFMQRAITKDPGFAMAHLNLANSAPTGTEFFEHLGHAVKFAGKASPGEQLTIQAAQAGANADAAKALTLLQKLVADYPQDERAHFQLGGAYFGRQDYEKAIEEYRRAIAIAPDYSPAYNIVGYAYRTVGRYGEAEEVFKKYIELIPDDPNPYDSYAELLMKMGRFDESIAQYRKALDQNSQFAPSFIGISVNLMFQGKYDASRAEAGKLYSGARNDGEKRAAMFQNTVTYVEEGKFDQALAELDKQFALGKATGDAGGMAGDAVSMGNVLLDTGKPTQALKKYEQAVQVTQASKLDAEIKENSKVLHRYNAARVAIATKDLTTAKREGDALMQASQAAENPFQIRLGHEVAGMIALAEKNYDGALTHLAQANQQDPYNLYRQGLAYEGKGDGAKAGEMFKRAAEFNQLPTINSALVRAKKGKPKV
jgi:tetratricopeptide (TPR) repeat protein